MSRWFRHYAGMMRDDKLVRVAIQSKQSVERVLWVWGAILESASEVNDGGKFDFDVAEAAYFLRASEDDIRAVVDGLIAVQRLVGDCVVNWRSRQFESDRSAPRQAAYRERKRAKERDSDTQETEGDGQVTSPSRHGDAPETETEAHTEKKEEGANAPRARSAKKDRKRATPLPTDFQPDWAAATAAGLSRNEGEREFLKFKNHAEANGRTCVSWPAAWRNWCISAAGFLKKPLKSTGPPVAMTIVPTSRSWNAWKAHFRDTGLNGRASIMDRCADEGRPFTVESEFPPGFEVCDAA